MDLQTVGKFVVVAGLAVVLLGGLLWLAGRMGLTSLPGTLRFGGDGWTLIVPIGLSILLSLLLTGLLLLFGRFLGR